MIPGLPQTHASLPFAASEFLTMGVEVEAYLVDPFSGAPVPRAPELLALLPHEPGFQPESLTTIVEFATDVCANLDQVENQLRASASKLQKAAQQLGVGVMVAGTHPFAGPAQPSQVWPTPRYQELLERDQWLGLVANTVGLHVHIGVRGPEHAIQMINGASPYLAHLLALSANSPFLNGQDTGLASARVTCYESQPTAGPAPTLHDWSEFECVVRAMFHSGSIQSLKDLHWDIRPCPALGTVEVRICDGQSNLEDTLALVTVIRYLFAWLDDRWQNGERFEAPALWRLRENKWRALRWGHEADFVVDDSGRVRTFAQEWRELFRAFESLARSNDELRYLQRARRMLQRAGYQWQRRRLQLDGTQQALVKGLVAQWYSVGGERKGSSRLLHVARQLHPGRAVRTARPTKPA